MEIRNWLADFGVLMFMFTWFLNMLQNMYEFTAEGRRVTTLDQILLNGNNIAILVPGNSPDPE